MKTRKHCPPGHPNIHPISMRQERSLKCLAVCVAAGLWFDVQGAPAALPEVSEV